MKELFLEILTNEKAEEILPFLQKYTYDERRELVPEIKKKIKELQEYEYSGGRGEIKGTNNQFVILSIAAFVCFTLDEYKRNRISLSYLSDGFIKFHEYSQQDLMKKIRIDDILEWYCPKWLGEYLNDGKTNEDFKTADYNILMRWKEKGYISLSDELIVHTLYKVNYAYNIDKIDMYPDTLKKHIWLLFKYQTFIYVEHIGGKWDQTFKKITDANKIDRLEVLKACLSAFNHNFNKPLTSWFVELFNNLDPTEKELLKIQDDLFNSLYSVQSKAVTNSLKLLKSLVSNPLFKAEDFISCIPVLLISSIKAIVSNTLVIIEKIIKEKPELSDILNIYVVDVFSQKEEALQKKACQLINKFGNPESEELKNKVAVYKEQILLSIQPELKRFLPESETVTKELSLPDNIKEDILSPVRENNKVKEITDWEDFIFFLGSAYAPDQTLTFDLIPALFIKFNSMITAENVNQLLPLIQKSYKIQQEWTSGLRLFDRLLSAFITSYSDYLEEKFPEITEDMQSLKKEFAKKYQRERPLSLDNWSTRVTSSLTYEPYYQILEYSLNKIKKQETLPLLSTPTHEPCWIDPLILTERLVLYQKNNENPNTMDVQLALQRCVLDNPVDAISFVTDNLTGEYKELLLFLLNSEKRYSYQSGEHPAWWFTACFTSGKEIPEDIQEAFPNFPQEYITGDYKWKILKDTLSFEYPYYTLSGNDRELFMNYIISAKIGGGIFETDLPHLLFSMPNRHDWIWVYVLKHYMKHPENDATQNNVLCTLISDLQMLNSGLTNITYLFFACTLVNANKTVRSVAGEYWIDLVYKDRIENFRLGEILGKLESKEWAPVKRFTDLISENLWNISNNHDQGLQVILESFISELTHLVKNSKKVLELYYELLIRNQALPEAKVILKLQSWESENSLKKICKQIVNKTTV